MPKKTVPPSKSKSNRVSKPNGAAIGKALAQAVKAELPAVSKKAAAEEQSRAEQARAAKEKHIAARAAESQGGDFPNHPKLYYDDFNKGYLHKHQGRFRTMGERQLRLILAGFGLSQTWIVPGACVLEIDVPLQAALNERIVDYAGPMPGWREGLHTNPDTGRRMLVTEEPRGIWDDLPKGKVPEPEFCVPFIKEILADNEQWFHFFHVLATSLRSLRRGDFRPGHFNIICGEAEAGKSLLEKLVTAFYGGRSADPFKPMCEGITFNAELAHGEHWVMDDPKLSTRMEDRIALASMIKTFFHVMDFTFVAKGKQAFFKTPCFRRGMLLLNDTPEDLRGAPPFREGVEDKINCYLVQRATECLKKFFPKQSPLPGLNIDGNDGIDVLAIGNRIRAEIVQLRHWVLQNFPEVPEFMRDNRRGVTHYHHPLLLAKMAAHTPQANWLGYVDSVLFDRKGRRAIEPGWGVEGTDPLYREHMESAETRWLNGPVDLPFVACYTSDLEPHLSESRYSEQLRNSLRQSGNYLARLAKDSPHRVSKLQKRDGYQLWKITNPFLNTPKTEE